MSLCLISDPGKFEGKLELSRIVYEETIMNGFYDEMENTEDGESYTLVKIDSILVGPEVLTDAESKFLAKQAGAIVYESSDGFVSFAWYEGAAKLQVAWDYVAKHLGQEL